MLWLFTWLLLLVQAPPGIDISPERNATFLVTTSDSAGLSRWLEANGFVYQPRRLGRFKVRSDAARLEALSEAPGILGVEPVRRQRTDALDPSRTLIRADPVHLGTGLSRARHGAGTLVGIVDNGFDLTHPAFLDSAGNPRILRLWDHTNASGRPPAGSSTGTLFSGTSIATLGRSGTAIHHGTHVAGLAAARSVPGSGGDWWGVADQASLALVDCGPGCTGLDEGIEYLYGLADSLGLPIVVNVSWGNHEGPRDGKGSDCVLLGSLLGPGKLATASTGNSGATAGHAVHVFASVGDTVRLATQTSAGAQTSAAGDTLRKVTYGKVEFWGDSGKTFKAWIEFLDSTGAVLAISTPQTAGRTVWKTISQIKPVGADTFWVDGSVQLRSGKGGLHLSAFSNRKDLRLRMVVTASSATVHGWTLEEGQAFLVDTTCTDCLTPDHEHMLSDKSTCPHQIAVGAVDASGKEAWFTSRGPGLALRPKPDLSAPGFELISTLNSAAGAWPVSGSLDGYRWGPMSGTSMSAPLVAGALALLLEHDPKLTTDSALSLLKGGSVVHHPGTGWGVLDVERMFEVLDPAAPAVGVARATEIREVGLTEWVTAEGARIRVPKGDDPRHSQPKGISWLRECSDRGCVSKGSFRP